jgi:hypothetical protein
MLCEQVTDDLRSGLDLLRCGRVEEDMRAVVGHQHSRAELVPDLTFKLMLVEQAGEVNALTWIVELNREAKVIRHAFILTKRTGVAASASAS